MTQLLQFNTRLPKATLDTFGQVIHKLRHSKQDVADAALRHFSALPTHQQVEAIIGERPSIETAKSLLLRKRDEEYEQAIADAKHGHPGLLQKLNRRKAKVAK